MATAPTETANLPGFRLLNGAARLKELTGAYDLILQYGLRGHYDVFCKRSLVASVAETSLLSNVIGDTEIRTGEGMELHQVFQDLTMDFSARVQPFDLDTLRQAFDFRESGLIQLSEGDRGHPTISGKIKDRDHKDSKKNKKHKDKEKDKDKEKEHKKHKHRHKDKDKDKDKDRRKDRSGSHENGDDRSKKHHKKKRKHDVTPEDGDSHRHKKRKHKDSKGDDGSHMKNGN